MERPDLTFVDPQVRAYIEYLESKVTLKPRTSSAETRDLVERAVDHSVPLPAEMPTTVCIVSASQNGYAKRTFRHLFNRQHRSGMGIFDLDCDEPDEPAVLCSAEENQNLLLFTNRARVFRYTLNRLSEAPVRSRGEYLLDRLPIDPSEKLVGILPEQASGYVALLSATGKIRCLRHHLFGEHMKPGTAMFRYEDFGQLASVCWTTGNAELFIATRKGMAIRFSEKLLEPTGGQGIRLGAGDEAVAVTPVYDDSGVFLLGADGKGTIRQMTGFAANKTPGGSGKIAMKCDRLVGAVTVESNDDLFIITRLGKIIRFMRDEVPETEGTIQGVNCISMRGDEPAAVIKSAC